MDWKQTFQRTVSCACVLLMGLPVIAADSNLGEGEVVAVLGTGRVGGALGPRFAKLGFEVIYGSRDPSKDSVRTLVQKTGHGASALTPPVAVEKASWVVFAVPWNAMEATVNSIGSLDGKILVDVTNALRVGSDGHMAMAVPGSAGQLLQEWAPEGYVVKAFNTMGFHVMADPQVAGGTVTVPLAGDNEEAKRRVGDVVRAMGFDAIDVGPIKHARILESMSIIYMVPYMSGRREQAFEYYFRQGS